MRKIFDSLERPARDVLETDEHYTLISDYPSINYTLFNRHTRFQPWVVAWCFKPDKGYWEQGHYFEYLLEATEYIREQLENK